jgi:hypothetical protein
MSKSIKIFVMSLMMTSTVMMAVNADQMAKEDLSVKTVAYYEQQLPIKYTQLPESTDIQDRAVAMFLDHGITGLVLLILGWWYYQRQKRWDEESAGMRRELLEYVKADQTSDYEMMNRIDTSKQELKELIHQVKEEIMREIDRR